MAETRCTWCTKRTSPASFKKMGMCGDCTKMHERYGFTETLARIPESVEATVAQVIAEQPTLDRAAAQMKKKYPLKHPLREWDMTLIVLVDERRRQRERS